MRSKPERRPRAIRIRASHIQGGQYRDLNAPSVVYQCARKAYAESGIDAKDVHIAEVHDATSSCELLHYESLGFCPKGTAGAYAESGETTRSGSLPVNLSGGLVSKGHPLGATGLGMIHELVLSRGDAGELQVSSHPSVALAQNAAARGLDEPSAPSRSSSERPECMPRAVLRLVRWKCPTDRQTHR